MAIFATTVDCLTSIVCRRLEQWYADQPELAESTLREHSDWEALGMPEIGHRAIHHQTFYGVAVEALRV